MHSLNGKNATFRRTIFSAARALYKRHVKRGAAINGQLWKALLYILKLLSMLRVVSSPRLKDT